MLYIGEKKEYFTELLCKYTLKDVSFFKMQQAWLFFFFLCERSSDENQPPPPSSSSVVFWSKVQWWCNTAFSSHLLSLPKNPCPKAISRQFNWESNYGISVPSLFSFSPPLWPKCRCSSVDHQMNFWALLLLQNVSDDWILLWCCDFCKTVVLGLWTVVDNTGWNHVCITTYRNYWMSGRKVGLRCPQKFGFKCNERHCHVGIRVVLFFLYFKRSHSILGRVSRKLVCVNSQ